MNRRSISLALVLLAAAAGAGSAYAHDPVATVASGPRIDIAVGDSPTRDIHGQTGLMSAEVIQRRLELAGYRPLQVLAPTGTRALGGGDVRVFRLGGVVQDANGIKTRVEIDPLTGSIKTVR